MTNEEKIEAISSIAEGVLDKYPYRSTYAMVMSSRFDRWGPSASAMFIEVMEEKGYELVKKEKLDD